MRTRKLREWVPRSRADTVAAVCTCTVGTSSTLMPFIRNTDFYSLQTLDQLSHMKDLGKSYIMSQRRRRHVQCDVSSGISARPPRRNVGRWARPVFLTPQVRNSSSMSPNHELTARHFSLGELQAGGSHGMPWPLRLSYRQASFLTCGLPLKRLPSFPAPANLYLGDGIKGACSLTMTSWNTKACRSRQHSLSRQYLKRY